MIPPCYGVRYDIPRWKSIQPGFMMPLDRQYAEEDTLENMSFRVANYWWRDSKDFAQSPGF
jgi:hypothetical protein